MCEQCSAGTVSYGPVVPVILVRATRDGLFMRAGDWGLAEINDPFVHWSGEILRDPLEGMSDDQINSSPPEIDDLQDAFEDAVDAFEDRLLVRPDVGHRLVEACLREGYTYGGIGLGVWLFDRMAKLVLAPNKIPGVDPIHG